MNRSTLVQAMIYQTGLSRQEARWFIDQFFEIITEALEQKGRIEFRGFGVFKVAKRNQSSFVNPKNGLTYPSRVVKTVLFQPSNEIK